MRMLLGSTRRAPSHGTARESAPAITGLPPSSRAPSCVAAGCPLARDGGPLRIVPAPRRGSPYASAALYPTPCTVAIDPPATPNLRADSCLRCGSRDTTYAELTGKRSCRRRRLLLDPVRRAAYPRGPCRRSRAGARGGRRGRGRQSRPGGGRSSCGSGKGRRAGHWRPSGRGDGRAGLTLSCTWWYGEEYAWRALELLCVLGTVPYLG